MLAVLLTVQVYLHAAESTTVAFNVYAVQAPDPAEPVYGQLHLLDY